MLKVAKPMSASVYDGRHSSRASGLPYYGTTSSSTSSSLPEPPSSSSSRLTAPPGGGGGSLSLGEPGPSTRHQQQQQPTFLGSASWEPCVERTPFNCSLGTVENVRYSLEEDSRADHSNEDRFFALEKRTFKVFAVFDGHDGERAAGFASSYMRELFNSGSWEGAVRQGGEIIATALEQFFKATESQFFRSIQSTVSEVQALKAAIPPGLKSFEAYQRYPNEVKRLSLLEPRLSGGCTSAIAVLADNFLYVANVGDSRVLVIKEKPGDGTLVAEQLSKDHSVEDEGEMRRLVSLGLRREDLERSGRLGMHDNTRSIGDYYIKEGYKDVDVLSSAREQPGICSPHIVGRPVDASFRYLVVMSDGVYKGIESTFKHQSSIESNKLLIGMIMNAVSKGQSIDSLAGSVLHRLEVIHSDCYYTHAQLDARSPLATACRKRDDMTLIVYKFPRQH